MYRVYIARPKMAAACADDGTAFVVENGAVYACGRGQYGQLGLNSREHQRLPARVGGEEVHGGSPVLMVAACGLHRATLTEDGAIWTCGRGSEGQLGHGDAQDRLLPTRLGPEAFGGLPVVLVTCGGENTMALTGVGGCLDVRRQRQCPARPRRQDRQAPVYAGGPRALWGSQHRRGGRR
jgi:alpha-tubulin suppressor-like RCC1 family protein